MTNATLTAGHSTAPRTLRRRMPVARIAAHDVVRPSELSAEARTQLAQELYVLCDEIFGGPNTRPLAEGLANGAAGDVTLCRYFDRTGRLVGFTAALLAELELDGAAYSIFRGMSALLPEFRGGQTVAGFWARLLIQYRLRHPRRHIYFFTPVAHISSFRVFAKNLPTLYPYTAPTPEALRVMRALKTHFHYGTVEGGDEWLCNRAAWTKEDAAIDRRLGRNDVINQFWKRTNPHPERGDCLLVLFPVTAANLAGGLVKYAATQLERRLGLSGGRRQMEGVRA